MYDLRLILLLFALQSSVSGQSMLPDFLNQALSIFSPSQAHVRGANIREGSTIVRPVLEAQRDTSILGAPARTPLHDVPICNGDSKLCSFIACQAENFKNDQSFANLNLAAQVLGDKKLRHTVGEDPDAINAVCMDSGMDSSRCATFTRGFQMISRFLNSIEKPIDDMQAAIPPPKPLSSMALNPLFESDTSGVQTVASARGFGADTAASNGFMRVSSFPPGVQRTAWMSPDGQSWGTTFTRSSPLSTLSVQRFGMMNRPAALPQQSSSNVPSGEPIPDMPSPINGGVQIHRMDDYDFSWATRSPNFGASNDAPSRAFGSQTWSSKDNKAIPVDDSLQRNDWVSSFTPLPAFAPSPPTAPPLAFPTVQSVLPGLELFKPVKIEPENSFNKIFSPVKIDPILRHRRHTDNFVRLVDEVARRVKRADDYYDQAFDEDASKRRSGGSRSKGGETRADDYYDDVDSGRKNRPSSHPGRPRQQRNCFELLG